RIRGTAVALNSPRESAASPVGPPGVNRFENASKSKVRQTEPAADMATPQQRRGSMYTVTSLTTQTGRLETCPPLTFGHLLDHLVRIERHRSVNATQPVGVASSEHRSR